MSEPSVIRGALGKLYALWMGFARILGYVTQPIFFFVVFMLGFGPVGMCFKLLGIDHLDRRLSPDPSCWKDYDGGNDDIESMKRQF